MQSVATQSTKTRSDQRSSTQIRTLACERSVLNRADGSARWCQGKTSILVSVYGPQATAPRKEHPEKAIVEVVFKPKSGLAGNKERLYEQLISRTSEAAILTGLHPRTGIALTVQVEHDDGSLMPCALNATYAALLDAGIPMIRGLAAVSCALTTEGGVVIDPDAKEEESAQAVASLAFLTGSEGPEGGSQQPRVQEGVLTSHSVGPMAVEQYLSIVQTCRAGCQLVAEFNRASLQKSFVARD